MAKDLIGPGGFLPGLVVFAWLETGPRGGMGYARRILPDVAKLSVMRS
jgi:hypothetical protein